MSEMLTEPLMHVKNSSRALRAFHTDHDFEASGICCLSQLRHVGESHLLINGQPDVREVQGYAGIQAMGSKSLYHAKKLVCRLQSHRQRPCTFTHIINRDRMPLLLEPLCRLQTLSKRLPTNEP